MSERNEERRRAERYPHRAYATASTPDKTYSAHLLNISQTGALIAIIDGHELHAGDHVQFSPDDTSFSLDAEVAHVKSHYVGLRYKGLSEVDLEHVQALIQEVQAQKN